LKFTRTRQALFFGLVLKYTPLNPINPKVF